MRHEGKMEHLEKTLSCVKIFELIAIKDASEAEIKASIRKNLGPSWSVVSVAQFLTGNSALSTFEALPASFEFEGLDKLKIGLLIATAHDFCANVLASGPISNGIRVGNFSKDSELTDFERLASIFRSKRSMN
jgi:hypothetical protein